MTGPELRAAQDRLGLNVKQMASILDVDPAHLSRMLNGHKPVTSSKALLVRYMLAYGLPETLPAE